MNPETVTYALDFESYYDAYCSIKTLGPRGYFSHPNFDAYMVTVVGDNGYSYVGCPRAFDWSLLDGAVVLSHNASFDESLYLYGVEQGWFARCAPSAWHCTADMTAFLGLPRALKNASAAVLGAEVDKIVRDNMKGKRWETMTPEFRAEVAEYALKDSELCLQLWQALQERWPLRERKISALNRRIGQRGLPMDTALLQHNLEHIKTELFNFEQAIPWTKDYTPLSRKAFNEQCRKQGIKPPSSLAQDSEEADKWFAEHQQACPWARAVQSYRRINSFTRKLEAFDAGTMPDGRYYGGLMYCGANPTARFSGSGGNLNLQNLPREETFGVNFRHMIRPAEGRKLVVVDLAQIEVRTLFWWAKDQKGLEMIRQAPDIYEVIAIILGMHDPANGSLKDNKPLRQKVKAMALGCQFGLGPDGFAAYSGMPLSEATDAVNLYQSRMRTITKFWDQLREDMVMSSSLGEPLQIELPSGRVMDYGVPRKMKTVSSTGKMRFAHVGKMVRNGQLRDFRLWHGLLAENCAQGLARDIFSEMLLRIDEAGHDIILHVHDEVVIECDAEKAEKVLAECLEIMSTPPAWIPDIPLSAEGEVLDFYSK
jgi:DNA polymerase